MTEERPFDARYVVHIQQQAGQLKFSVTDPHTGEEQHFSSLLKAFEFLEQQFRPSPQRNLR